MSGYRDWVAKQRGNPLMLFVALGGAIGGFYIGYTKLWAPFFRRRKLAQAQIYGDYVFEQEVKRKNQ